MKASLVYAIVIIVSASSAALGEQNLDQIQKLEASGDTVGARTALAHAAQSNPNSVPAWTAYAEFLDRYGDPGARDAYAKVLAALNNSGDTARGAVVARRLALLDLVNGDRGSATRNLDTLLPLIGTGRSIVQ